MTFWHQGYQRHEFYFCVKDAEKTCKYVILSVQGVFYKFFCTSMTTGIIIGFYYYIFSMMLYRKNSASRFRGENIIYFSGRWLKIQKMWEMDLKTWDVLCLETSSYKLACFSCFACFLNLDFHFNTWWLWGDFFFNLSPTN